MEAGYVTFCKVPIRLTGEAQPSKGKPVSTTAFFKIKKNSHLYLSYILVHLLGGDRVGLLYVLGTRQPSFKLPCGSAIESLAERHGNWRAFSLCRSRFGFGFPRKREDCARCVLRPVVTDVKL